MKNTNVEENASVCPKKKERGITLIALVITIIVLLILAVVSIKLVFDGGIVSKTQDATLRYKVAEIDEASKLKISEEQMKKNSNESTPYLDFLNSFRGEEESATIFKIGNIYNKDTGDLIREDLRLYISDLIQDKNGDFGDIGIPEGSGLPFNIDINIGNAGYAKNINEYYPEHNAIPKTDVFAIDKDNNIYYITDKGDIIGADTIYKKEEIILSTTKPINPDTLPEEDKKIYFGIYNGALTFTNDEEYATFLASNDLDAETTVNTFMFNGYYTFDIYNQDGSIAEIGGKQLSGLGALMMRPDGSVVQIINDPIKINYFMDSEYNMYEYNRETKILKDSNGNYIENVESKITDNPSSKELNGYEYLERFDGKDVLIASVPNKEELNMKEDLAELNVYSIGADVFKNTIVKRVILPDTMKTFQFLALGRTDGNAGIFTEARNIEYIEIPNNIKIIYKNEFKNCTSLKEVIMPDNITEIASDAFTGCSNVTLKFKDGKAPSGSPWGGTNINITNK